MIEQINKIAEIWWNWMWPMFWQVSVLIGFIALIDFLIRKHVWPQVRYALWLLVLVKLLLSPSFALRTGVVSHVQPLVERSIRQPAAVDGEKAYPFIDERLDWDELSAEELIQPPMLAEPVLGSEPVESSVQANPSDQTTGGGPSSFSWHTIAMIVWMIVTLLLMLRLLLRHRMLLRVHCVERYGHDLPKWLPQLLDDTSQKLRLKRIPKVVLSSTVSCPAVLGIFRPVLLVPAMNIERLSLQETEHILLHELAHIKRIDLPAHALCVLLQIFYWFNPLLNLVRRQLQHLRELCCDATVAGILKDKRQEYCQTILKTAEWLLNKPRPCGIGLLGLIEDPDRLRIRLKWLQKKPSKYPILRIAMLFFVVVTMFAFVLPMAEARKPANRQSTTSSADVSGSEPKHDVAITGVSVLSMGGRVYTVPVVVNIENQGNCDESFDVKLIDVTDDKEIGTKPARLPAPGKGGIDGICDLTFTGETGGQQAFGGWLWYGGDVNGDGYDDLLVCAHGWNDHTGRVYLYYGGADMDNDADKIFTGEAVGDRFGCWGGAYLADMNKDGFDDVIIGARGYKSGDNTGRVYIYYGGPDMDEKPDIIVDPPADATESWYGRGVCAGDLNGDRNMDLIVNALAHGENQGRVYLYFGPLASDIAVDKIFAPETEPNAVFGAYTTARGDVNNDGCDDLLVGSRYYPVGSGGGNGRAWFFYGGPGTTMDEICDLTFDAENPGDQFGTGIDLFDIDNDGYSEVLIGARRWPSGRARGRVYLYWGSNRATMDNVADLHFDGEIDARANFGSGCVFAGYINKDDFGDIVVPAYSYYQGSQQGRAYIYFGNNKAFMDTICDRTFTPDGTQNQPHRARIGDFNGDGYGDVVMGGPEYNDFQGRCYLWYGGPGSSTDVTFYWNITNASPGKRVLKATIAPVTGEQDIADNTMTATVKDIVELLIAKDAGINAKNNAGQTPIEVALQRNRKDIVELFLEKGAKLSIHVAAYLGDINKVKSFIEAGVSVNVESGPRKRTPLYWAVKNDHKDVAELLIEKGADVSSIHLLYYACMHGHRDLAEFLIQKGADANSKNWGDTPSHYAVWRGHVDVLELLLAHGADASAKDSAAWSLLHYAAGSGSTDMTRLLLDKGADVNAKNNDGQTPLQIAKDKGHTEIAELLRKHRGKE